MIRFTGWSAACVAAVLVLAGPASAQVEEGKARKVPWSGYWWPTKQGLMVGANGPLAKYDRFIGGGKALAAERQAHPPGVGDDWWGYCHAWGAASVYDAE